ncbi:Nucleolar protein 8 [Heterocephalus glaber]|uniref:Nucleolar protein 8 n=1 Tax=Heterocephalus glaber TaxID=10181 RepID=G5BZI2_HETGA|nr:Nucleolar protein 8 [Heterocephalus glaber]
MKANRETKRLFVGGLSQAISKTDLQNQFSRFGEVSDVEIITRKDDQGNAQKVFAYVNIRVEADLKKCMSILNKTKWKGGTLQIQLAKESFLHRLAQEREEAKAEKEKSTRGKTNLSEKMGGVDFHMKAVPGTEVPGHKNWVVSKFGRILPVLHLKNQPRPKISFVISLSVLFTMPLLCSLTVGNIMKYDPSKYCHNLKKIREDFTNSIPITSLTWELEGGNEPMSKKRQREFSDCHDPLKKIMKVQKSQGSTVSPRTSWVMENNILPQQQAEQKAPPDSITLSKSHLVLDSDAQKLKNILCQTSNLEAVRKRNSMDDDDIDSEDELRMILAKEENLQRTSCSSDNEESERDEKYKAMMKNCPRINLTLADLEQLAGSNMGVPENTESSGPQSTTSCKFDRASKSPKAPRSIYTGKQCICPEEILASLLREENMHGKQTTGSAKIHKIGFDKDNCHGTQQREEASEEEESDSSSNTSNVKPPKYCPGEDTQEGMADFLLSLSNSLSMDAKAKPVEDNQKRLAALEARQKAKEAQKKLVHNALANLDGPPQDKLTHIIFGSDSESEMEEASTQKQNLPGELVKESKGKASGKLFDGEDKESDSEDDSDRFKIKPLMDLQLHFGSDDRFQMDSRFLESDSEEEQEEVNEKKTAEEEELATEKKKALNVVQSVLNINLNNTTSKGPVAAKKFKDIIHYPTSHDHITYERTKDDKPKESKAKWKKREEAEKLPEVSKDMYYNIATDLKEIFQDTKDTTEKEKDKPRHKGCGREKNEEVHSVVALMSGAEQPSEFMFSFFDSDSKNVKEGSDLFWRGVGSNISKNSWEARTNSLLMDCRKKHKEAKKES